MYDYPLSNLLSRTLEREANTPRVQRNKSAIELHHVDPPSTKNKLLQADFPLSYGVKLKLPKHHIVEESELLCVPNDVPEKSAIHMPVYEFKKSPKRCSDFS